jgi:membrane-associated phospholipid phosphatase
MLKIIYSFILITIGSSSYFAQDLDYKILKNINSSYTVTGGKIQTTITNSITPVTIAVPAGILAYSLFKRDSISRIKFYTIASSELVTGIITTSLKLAIRRERPFSSHNDIVKYSDAGSLSFPSGHTSAAFSIATSLSLEFPKWYVIVPSMLWASTMGYSRMYLGVHYPSDVIVGAIIGAGTSYLCYKANKWLHH